GHRLDHRRIVVHDENAPAHAPASRRRGNMIVTSSPWPGSERSEIFPPFFSSRSFVTPRPIPRPGRPDADADGLRQANVNACFCSSGDIPTPVSLIMTNACCATTLALTRTCPPAGVYLPALSSTLRNARWSATGSAATGISAPSATNSKRTLSPWASRYDSTRVESTRTRSEGRPEKARPRGSAQRQAPVQIDLGGRSVHIGAADPLAAVRKEDRVHLPHRHTMQFAAVPLQDLPLEPVGRLLPGRDV